MTVPSEEFMRRRRSRSIVTALVLTAFVILFFGITIAKLQG
jgi:hypothetical protein